MGPSSLHLTNSWHATSGGVRRVYQALLEAAERRGRRLTVVVPSEHDETIEVGRGTRVYGVRAPRAPFLDRRYRLLTPAHYLRPSLGRLGAILDRERPDVVEIADKYTLAPLSWLLWRRATRPTLMAFSHERLDDGLAAHTGSHRLASRLARAYLATCYAPPFDAHVANSDYTAAEVRAARPDAPVHVVPLGVDSTRFHPAARSLALRIDLLARAGARPTATLALYAGRLSREKGLDWLLPIVAGARRRGVDVCLVIAGDGPLGAALRARVSELGMPQVLFLGHVADQQALPALVASADVFVHPNPREPFGLGPLEAMASGVPLVAPRAGGLLTYASDDCAWLARPDVDGMGEALADACGRPEARRARAQAAQVVAAAHTWERTAEHLFALYDDTHARRLASPRRPLGGRRARQPHQGASALRAGCFASSAAGGRGIRGHRAPVTET